MSEHGEVCYTFEAAVEMAVKMEDEGFRHYLEAIRKSRPRQPAKYCAMRLLTNSNTSTSWKKRWLTAI